MSHSAVDFFAVLGLSSWTVSGQRLFQIASNIAVVLGPLGFAVAGTDEGVRPYMCAIRCLGGTLALRSL
jgi:hypothetical protein